MDDTIYKRDGFTTIQHTISEDLVNWLDDKKLDPREAITVLSTVTLAMAGRAEGLTGYQETDPATLELLDKVVAMVKETEPNTTLKALALYIYLMARPKDSTEEEAA